MNYEVHCECRKAHAVSAADAGASLRCTCGRIIEVPPLHKLRTTRGETAVPLLVQIRGMVASGQLPGARVCVRCQQPTKGIARVGFACEPTPSEVSSDVAVGCLFAFLFGSGTRLFRATTSELVRQES